MKTKTHKFGDTHNKLSCYLGGGSFKKEQIHIIISANK